MDSHYKDKTLSRPCHDPLIFIMESHSWKDRLCIETGPDSTASIICTRSENWTPSQYKDGISRYGISIIKIRRSCDRLIFIMGMPTMAGKTVPLYWEGPHNPRNVISVIHSYFSSWLIKVYFELKFRKVQIYWVPPRNFVDLGGSELM